MVCATVIQLQKIKSLIKHPDIRRLLGNFFSLSILKVFNLILPFVTLPYLIKTLGLSQYGVITIALSLSMYFQAVTGYGFNLSATREVALHRHSKRQLSLIYSNVMWSKALLLLISILIIVPLVFIVPQFSEHKSVYLLMLLYLSGDTFFPEWFFRGVEQMFYITILDLLIKGSFTIFVFILIHNPGDYWLYPLIYGVGFIVVSFVAHCLIFIQFKLKLFYPKSTNIWSTLKNGFPLFINQFFPNLYNNTTGFLVGIIVGDYAAGIFGAVRQLTNLLSVFDSVVTTVLYPYLSRNRAFFSYYRRYYFIVYSLLSILFLYFLNTFLSFLGVFDSRAWYIGLFLIIGLYFVALYNIHATNYLIVHKQNLTVMSITIVASVFGFFGSFIFIYQWGAIGGAINIALSELIMGVLAILFFNIHTNKAKHD